MLLLLSVDAQRLFFKGAVREKSVLREPELCGSAERLAHFSDNSLTYYDSFPIKSDVVVLNPRHFIKNLSEIYAFYFQLKQISIALFLLNAFVRSLKLTILESLNNNNNDCKEK